ncbi:hypothetical protein E5991_08755 [Bifidobacterium pseudolongum]|uniref:Uncharacterized protein n=1 Tax=Bifidobacterium pseudolongum TaxID=1694 RepID=A0A4S4F3U6_9BIFI|nr:hypothetical protein [Bifidobacterium pseudolongum]THG24239.1 hypothetical protein E5991_08755 [Bifidobacterium pseudolongum]
MSEFELRVTPSSGPNGLAWFYNLAVERGGLRVESSLRAMDLDALYRSCDRPVQGMASSSVPLVVGSRNGEARLEMVAGDVRVSLPVDAGQRRRLRDLCEQGLSMDRAPQAVSSRERGADARPVRKGRAR